jgi:hypothetical protein
LLLRRRLLVQGAWPEPFPMGVPARAQESCPGRLEGLTGRGTEFVTLPTGGRPQLVANYRDDEVVRIERRS